MSKFTIDITIKTPDLAAALHDIAEAVKTLRPADPLDGLIESIIEVAEDVAKEAAAETAPKAEEAAPVAPVSAPAAPVAEAPAPVPAPAPAPAVAEAPAPVPTAAPAPPVPGAGALGEVQPVGTAAPVSRAVPTADAPAPARDAVMTAGAALVDAGKMDALVALLAGFGVQAVTQLRDDQLAAFAAELRGLGALL